MVGSTVNFIRTESEAKNRRPLWHTAPSPSAADAMREEGGEQQRESDHTAESPETTHQQEARSWTNFIGFPFKVRTRIYEALNTISVLFQNTGYYEDDFIFFNFVFTVFKSVYSRRYRTTGTSNLVNLETAFNTAFRKISKYYLNNVIVTGYKLWTRIE